MYPPGSTNLCSILAVILFLQDFMFSVFERVVVEVYENQRYNLKPGKNCPGRYRELLKYQLIQVQPNSFLVQKWAKLKRSVNNWVWFCGFLEL